MSFSAVTDFEQALADYWQAPYAVAVDCCTHAIELCLRLSDSADISIPRHTYISVPMTAEKLGISWNWCDTQWENYYTLGNTRIIDSAVHWRAGGYVLGSLQCLSFQFKKPLNLGRGGAILCGDYADYVKLKRMSYDGRWGDEPWMEQDIKTLGYHYYMTPETAALGLEKLPTAYTRATKRWSWRDYPDCSEFSVFKPKTGLNYYV